MGGEEVYDVDLASVGDARSWRVSGSRGEGKGVFGKVFLGGEATEGTGDRHGIFFFHAKGPWVGSFVEEKADEVE